jgi:hypothetical protein
METPVGVEGVTPRNFAFENNDEMITPEDHGVTMTPGHGHSEDVYSQRRRRRRMDMES